MEQGARAEGKLGFQGAGANQQLQVSRPHTRKKTGGRAQRAVLDQVAREGLSVEVACGTDTKGSDEGAMWARGMIRVKQGH